jgi:hypothetical protein
MKKVLQVSMAQIKLQPNIYPTTFCVVQFLQESGKHNILHMLQLCASQIPLVAGSGGCVRCHLNRSEVFPETVNMVKELKEQSLKEIK